MPFYLPGFLVCITPIYMSHVSIPFPFCIIDIYIYFFCFSPWMNINMHHYGNGKNMIVLGASSSLVLLWEMHKSHQEAQQFEQERSFLLQSQQF